MDRFKFFSLQNSMDNALQTILEIFYCWNNSTSSLLRSGPKIIIVKFFKICEFSSKLSHSRILSRAMDSWNYICIYKCQTRDNEDRLWSMAVLNLEYYRVHSNEEVWKYQ